MGIFGVRGIDVGAAVGGADDEGASSRLRIDANLLAGVQVGDQQPDGVRVSLLTGVGGALQWDTSILHVPVMAMVAGHSGHDGKPKWALATTATWRIPTSGDVPGMGAVPSSLGLWYFLNPDGKVFSGGTPGNETFHAAAGGPALGVMVWNPLGEVNKPGRFVGIGVHYAGNEH